MFTPDFHLAGHKKSWLLLFCRLVVSLLLWCIPWVVLAGVAWYGGQIMQVQRPATIRQSGGELPSRYYSAQGFQIGGLQRGQRAWVEFHDVSPDLIRAVLASEDERFFEHSGVDLRGILRAASANFAAGRVVQGGSTITQQLAKSFVGSDRTLARKFVELITARLIEHHWSKSEILEAWLNRIYFGRGAEGISSAAWIYFGVTPADLTLEQSAFLAGMLQSPSRFDPFEEPEVAQRERDLVLHRLQMSGLADARAASQFQRTALQLRAGSQALVSASDVVHAMSDELERLQPGRDWRYGNADIYSTVDLVRQRVAESRLQRGLRELDRRQGLRQHVASAAGDGDAAARRREAIAGLPRDNEVRLAEVIAVSETELTVFDGEERVLFADAWAWAVPWQEDGENHGATIERPGAAFAVGDVVALDADYRVTQRLRLSGAFGSADLVDGALEVVVGADAGAVDGFDRFLEGCRQPGSTFKPIVYSAALDRGLTPGTILRDSPIRFELGPQEEWRPRNADGRFGGHMTAWEAFIWSRNLPAIEVFRWVGFSATQQRARELGLTSPLENVESLVLGASCVRPVELLTAYATFARTGYRPRLHALASVFEGGEPVWAGGSAAALHHNAWVRVQRLWSTRREPPVPAISAANAWSVAFLLRDVVQRGTGSEYEDLPFPVAGKTGTTTAYDAWFAGFTPREAAVVWIGTDRNTRPLGRRETGGRLAMPVWVEGLLPAAVDFPLLARQPAELVMLPMDPESGLLAPADRWAVTLPFYARFAPVEVAPTREEQTLQRMDQLQREF